jgi:hypothetical protein
MLYNLSRMRLLAVATLLFVLPSAAAFAQTATPRSGKLGYALAASSVISQSPASSNSPAQPGGRAPSEPSQTVKISEFPPVSVAKDWSDQAYWLFTLFLVAVGALQVFLLWGNLRAIERQALQMERQTGILDKSVALAEKNADTARQSVEMFINRERGHLRIELTPLQWPPPAGALRVTYRVTLYGATEAYISGSCARVEITDSPDPGEDAQWWPAMTVPQVITADNRVQEAPVQGVFPKSTLEPSDIDAIDAGRKFIHFRGFIKYNDVFGAERWTRCRRMWEMSMLRNPDGSRSGHWSKRGSSKDNSET